MPTILRDEPGVANPLMSPGVALEPEGDEITTVPAAGFAVAAALGDWDVAVRGRQPSSW